MRALIALFMLALAGFVPFATGAESAAAAEAPLIVGNRTVHVFRAPLGSFTPTERAAAAHERVKAALAAGGEGWTSVRPDPQGMLIELDGKPLFTVLPGDAQNGTDESPNDLANRASRTLQKVWSEAQERKDPAALLRAAIRAVVAAAVAGIAMFVVLKLSRFVQAAVTTRLARRLETLRESGSGARLGSLLLNIASRSCVLIAWLLSLALVFAFLTYALDQFVQSRPLGEGLSQSLSALLMQALHATAGAIPGAFIAIIIFLAAWVCTQVSAELFSNVAAGRMKLGLLNAHTAPATRRIANASIWLFAVAMAYPYLPGSQTEAFKGVSVLVGLVVTIGASGLVGQVASGVILVYTHALAVGEYVQIQDCEGTVTELGLFVTRIRTGLGVEIALPNSLVLANVTRNYSRVAGGPGFLLDTSLTIGYDTPWRQVHAMLLEAARAVPEIHATPAPYVVQTALSDFYVAYKLVVYVGAGQAAVRPRVASDLYAAIQDAFNRNGVQIMSPHYFTDPAAPKVVPVANWHLPPAESRRGSGPGA